jgi:hypothetical protein
MGRKVQERGAVIACQCITHSLEVLPMDAVYYLHACVIS